VRAYHAVLEKLGLRPHRSLEEDLTLQSNLTSYGGSDKPLAAKRSNNDMPPDFTRLTSQERAAYHRERLKHLFGS
ncbi:MAG: hypothetical protein ACREIV_15875, partial [Planctomycetaceae bacterium]